MSLQRNAAIVATFVLGLVMVLQVLLAAGLPLGRAAWGGRYRILPAKLRWASVATTLVLAAAAFVVLARAKLIRIGAESVGVRTAAWVFTGFFVLNTLGNLGSSSRTERYVMTIATVLLFACFAVVALSR
jgi:hypothetical protein